MAVSTRHLVRLRAVIFYLAGLRKRKLKVGLSVPKTPVSLSLQAKEKGERDQFHNPFCFTAPSL
jgi:hypothetical protein